MPDRIVNLTFCILCDFFCNEKRERFLKNTLHFLVCKKIFSAKLHDKSSQNSRIGLTGSLLNAFALAI